MDAFEIVRSEASKLHAAINKDGSILKPIELVTAAARHLDIEIYWLNPGDPSLKGAKALFDHQGGAIFAENAGDETTHALLAAHELGHATVHGSSAECSGDDIDPSRSAEASQVGVRRVEDYGARERRELQADVFAREFVLPRTLAARLYVSERKSSADISSELKLPVSLVRQQLLDALLIPAETSGEKKAAENTGPALPDPAQDNAAAHRGTPFQLQAGPGTGKTRTLVKRVLSLLDENVEPSSILVLTFSNKAANELFERITAAAPDKAAQIWIGTFHAFGLDLIRRHYDKLGLPSDPALFDRSDAIAVLEEILPTLNLKHFRNLWDPSMVLREVLAAISRAKDEMADHEKYLSLAKAMDAAAAVGDEEAKQAAAECLEIAQIFRRYEEEKKKRGAVDFADLIMMPINLIENDANVRASIELRHRHILLDEYQDVNRASVRLIKAISGDAKRLWVVGDARQSIYRFRGASSINMEAFNKDFKNAKVDKLGVSYRSTKKVIDVFSTFAPGMGASKGMLPLNLKPNRGEGTDKPELRIFDMEPEENLGIAEAVLELRDKGVRFKDQAILCRTNPRIDKVAKVLESLNIPVLHLGSLFEREEIRDLLAVLSLATDPFGDSLARVARFPRYNIPLQDIYKVVAALREKREPLLKRLNALESIKDLSNEGKRGSAKLISDLKPLTAQQNPWAFIAGYLFDTAAIARDLAAADTVTARMRNIAIWQFMNFLRDQPVGGFGSPVQKVLERVRQLVLLNEERELRQVPDSALHIDAVRLMTVHGSKGLEFEAVHVAGLNEQSFPLSHSKETCPPPVGLIEGTEGRTVSEAAEESHTDEEECLFFVAVSRARTHLRLYHSRRYPTRKRDPSGFLERIAGTFDCNNAPPLHDAADTEKTQRLIEIQKPADYAVSDQRLEHYQNCPRRFFYTHVLGLGSARKTTPFSQTHDCVYEALRWLAEARQKENPTLAEAEAAFEEIWKNRGPHEHAFAPDYRQLASALLEILVRSGENRKFRKSERLIVSMPNGRIEVEPNEIVVMPDSTVVLRRVRTGRKAKSEYDGLEYTLYKLAGKTHFGDGFSVEALHLSEDILEPVDVTPKKLSFREKKADEILAAINSGEFPPKYSPEICPRCPHFFICPSIPDGPLKI